MVQGCGIGAHTMNQARRQKDAMKQLRDTGERKVTQNGITAARNATTGEPGSQQERTVVVNTEKVDPTADQELWKRYVLVA